MQKTDLKKTFKALYTAPKGRFVEVEVPTAAYLMVDGAGDPETSPQFQQAMEALYSVAYPLKFFSKKHLDRDFSVMPPEGLWWADDMESFANGRRDHWKWTLMIMQPEWITAEMVEKACSEAAKKKDNPAIKALRLETLDEGKCLQTLHIGSYEDEAPVLRHLHHDIMPEMGVVFAGKHHEIYLSDPRRTTPDKYRTILRQPVRPKAN